MDKIYSKQTFEFAKMDCCNLCGSTSQQELLNFLCNNVTNAREPLRIVKCKCCGLVFTNPRLNPQDIKKIYNDSYYLFQKTNTDSAQKKASSDYQSIKSFFKQKGNLLEIGCAQGFLLKRALEDGWKEAYGIEFSPFAAEFARKEFGLNVFAGELEKAPLQNNFFDAIIAIDIIEHVFDPKGFLRICKEKLTKEGVLIIGTPNFDSIFLKLTQTKWKLFDFTHVYYFTPKTLTKLCRLENLQIIHITTLCNEIFSRDGFWRLGLKPVTLKIISFKGFVKKIIRDTLNTLRIKDTTINSFKKNLTINNIESIQSLKNKQKNNSLSQGNKISEILNFPICIILSGLLWGDQIFAVIKKNN